jgi:glycine cleavage system H protein
MRIEKMNVPDELLYTEEHEWVLIDGDLATVGITDYAQSELGDIVYIEFPEVGAELKQMDPFGSVEAVKAVEELYAPVSGEVVEVNTALEEDFQTINQDPYSEGWLIKIKMSDESELDALLKPNQYESKIS